jgi:hypothetical protein
VKIGRRALAFTQVVDLTPEAPGGAGKVYSVKVNGLVATYTSLLADVLADVCTGLAAAVNALAPAYVGGTTYSAGDIVTSSGVMYRSLAAGNTGHTPASSATWWSPLGSAVTASGASGTKVVCTSTAGLLASYSTVASTLTLKDATTDPGIATDLAAILAADADWYGLLLDSQGAAEITATATWVEANKKLFVWQSADTASLSSASTTDIFYTTKAAGFVRSAGVYYPGIGLSDGMIAAAWMGEELPKDAGASTWMWKSLASVTVYALTETQRSALEAKNGNHYLALDSSNNITGPGESASGEWLDVVRDLDWLTARLRERTLGVLLANDKVPFTDAGISAVVSAVRAQLTEAVGKTVLAADPKFTITAPKASEVSAANKRARRLPDVKWSATLAGAIHTVVITGLVSL